jgi:antitoxin component YwqK of YwqJK toxin-antitoxin module
MKLLVYLTLLLMPGFCLADTFTLNDGTRLEGDVTGEMEGIVMVQTKYGSLTIKKTDIKEQKVILPAVAPAVSAQVAAALSTMTAAAVSTEAAAAVSTAAAVALSTAPVPAPKFTFATVQPSTSTRLLVYSENGVAIATETLNSSGAPLSLEGAIKDGTYTEYYDNGGLKTVKTLSGGQASGTLKAFYPSGTVQIEAYYLAGAKEGAFKYFAEDGKPLMEAAYRNDKLNGWKKEFDAAGAVKSETYYADDHLAEPPKPAAAAKEPAREVESSVTVKVMDLARGERFTFLLNGKYAGKATLDKEFNIIGLEGDIPDGAVKVYTRDGKLQKEFVFEKSGIKELRVYEPGGPLKAAYTYTDDKAVQKK